MNLNPLRAAAFVVIVALSGSVEARQGPGFDCAKVHQPLAQLICSNDELSSTDLHLNEAYTAYRNTLSSESQKNLDKEEVAFIQRVIKVCNVPADIELSELNEETDEQHQRFQCINEFYTERTAQLQSRVQKTSSFAQEKAADIDEVALVHAGSLYEIPVQINGAITLNFIIDSGASDVQIPLDVFGTLVRANTISMSDITGEQTYTLADGSKQKSPKFLIRELKIGTRVLRNVPGSVGSLTGSLLLGQSFLSYFGSWTLDNNRRVLRLISKNSEAPVGNISSSTDPEKPGPPRVSLSTPDLPTTERNPTQTVVLCGKPVEYIIRQTGRNNGFLGVWAGGWNNAGRLCGALVVQGIDPQGVADILYVYGSSRVGTGLAWKQQHRVGGLKDGVLTFQDDQGSIFKLTLGGRIGVPESVDVTFFGASGRLTGTFQKSH